MIIRPIDELIFFKMVKTTNQVNLCRNNWYEIYINIDIYIYTHKYCTDYITDLMGKSICVLIFLSANLVEDSLRNVHAILGSVKGFTKLVLVVFVRHEFWCLVFLVAWGVYQKNLQVSHVKILSGLEHVLFFHILGIIIPTDFHIFQRGWNHQPDFILCTMFKTAGCTY